MTEPTTTSRGMHHIAIMATDIKAHIAFFSEVVGCPLVAFFDMHGVPGGQHAFLKMGEHCYFSIVGMPDVAKAKIVVGQTHSGTGMGSSAPGTMQHFAFRTDNEAALLSLRDRIRSHGVNVIGPIDHGMCKSIYFAGPDQLTLEAACPAAVGGIDPRAWIDPKTCAKAGISADELSRYKSPKSYSGPSPVPQPPYDPSKPHQAYPLERYKKMLAAPDDVIAKNASFTDPPVKVPG